jgi:hypothetical protein
VYQAVEVTQLKIMYLRRLVTQKTIVYQKGLSKPLEISASFKKSKPESKNVSE